VVLNLLARVVLWAKSYIADVSQITIDQPLIWLSSSYSNDCRVNTERYKGTEA
jgi:hypothetical protein